MTEQNVRSLPAGLGPYPGLDARKGSCYNGDSMFIRLHLGKILVLHLATSMPAALLRQGC